MKRLLLALAVAAGLFPATRGAAQQRDSLAATVERLSAEVETLKGRSAAADRILSRLPRISGYLQLGYEWSDDASTFFVKRARVDFQGDISPKIDYRLQLEFASPKIVDIYLRYKPLEALNVQVGQFKVPFSIENTHYVPLKYEFIEYSMAVCRLMGFTDVCGVNATGRDLGAQLYGGLIDRDGYSILNYNVGVFNGEGINTKDKNKSKDVVARLMVQPLRALSFAGTTTGARWEPITPDARATAAAYATTTDAGSPAASISPAVPASSRPTWPHRSTAAATTRWPPAG